MKAPRRGGEERSGDGWPTRAAEGAAEGAEGERRGLVARHSSYRNPNRSFSSPLNDEHPKIARRYAANSDL